MLEPHVAGIIGLAVIGCGTGIVLRAISVIADVKRRALQQQLHFTQEILRLREERIAELERMNRQLETQVDWHAKLLESSKELTR
jgi:hypothetical protein